MAKAPSLESRIDKAGEEVEATCRIAATLSDDLGRGADSKTLDFAAAEAKMLELRAAASALDMTLAAIVTEFGVRCDSLYARFEIVDDSTRLEQLGDFLFRRTDGVRRRSGTRKTVIADALKSLLYAATNIHHMLAGHRQATTQLRDAAELSLTESMQQRRDVASAIDAVRYRGREVAAAIATVQRKIANARENDGDDDVRIAQWQTENAELQAEREATLQTREKLSGDHAALDRQAILLTDSIDLLNDGIASQMVLLNKLIAEAERCIQLYSAVSGTLEPLLAEAQLSHLDEAGFIPKLAVFRDILMLHAHGNVSMQDIDRQKKRADDALERRRTVARAG